MKLKIITSLKSSGIQYLGDIPQNWQLHKLKYLLSSLESGSRETGGGNQLDEGIFSMGGEHVNWDGTINIEPAKYVSEEYYNSMNRGKIQNNDTVLVKDGATIGKTALIRKKPFNKIAVNEHVYILRANKKVLPDYL